MEVMDKHKPKFGQDFSDNKKALDQVTIIRSKCLKNEIAGYITKYIKHEIRDNEIRHAQQEAAESATRDVTEATSPVETIEETSVTETTTAEPTVLDVTETEPTVETIEETPQTNVDTAETPSESETR